MAAPLRVRVKWVMTKVWSGAWLVGIAQEFPAEMGVRAGGSGL